MGYIVALFMCLVLLVLFIIHPALPFVLVILGGMVVQAKHEKKIEDYDQ